MSRVNEECECLFKYIYLFTSGDVGKLRLLRFLCDDDELPIVDIHSLYLFFFTLDTTPPFYRRFAYVWVCSLVYLSSLMRLRNMHRIHIYRHIVLCIEVYEDCPILANSLYSHKHSLLVEGLTRIANNVRYCYYYHFTGETEKRVLVWNTT